MNKANGVTELQYSSLVYAITHLGGYKVGKSSMVKYYFPIRSLSEAVNKLDEQYLNEMEQEDTFQF